MSDQQLCKTVTIGTVTDEELVSLIASGENCDTSISYDICKKDGKPTALIFKLESREMKA